VRLEGLGKLKKIHLIATRSRHLAACSIVPQATTLSPLIICYNAKLSALLYTFEVEGNR
jgi:hypothetical protein